MGCFAGWLAVLGSGWIAWMLWRGHQQRADLERRLGELEAEIAEVKIRLQSGASAAGEAAIAGAPTEVETPRIELDQPADDDSSRPPLAPLDLEDTTPESLPEIPTVMSPDQTAAGAAATPPAATPTPPAQPAPPARPPIDWEQWVGVRGAAVLGGIVLALAGIYFVRYSIQAGWVPPAVRVALGLVAGVAAIGAGEVLRKRGYSFAANGLAGAGVVLLYAAVWAGRALYGLFGTGLAFVVMTLITAAGGVLSWRHQSKVIALLGLVGGFATPLLLSSGSDQPIGLFGYLMLLNVGVVFLARRTGWSFLGAFALAGTVLYQGLWIFWRMGSDRTWLGLSILGAFVLFYVLVGWYQRRVEPPDGLAVPDSPARGLVEKLQRAGAVLTPFAFAVYFAAQAELGLHLWPIAMLLALLNVAAIFVSRIHRLPLTAPAAAAASLGVIVIWSVRSRFDSGLAIEAIAVLLALAAIHHLALEMRAREQGAREQGARGATWSAGSSAAVTATGALFWLLALWLLLPTDSGVRHFGLAFAGAIAAAALLVRQSALTASRIQEIAAAAGLGLHLFCALILAAFPVAGRPSLEVSVLLTLLVGAAFEALMFRRRSSSLAGARDHEAPPATEPEVAGSFLPGSSFAASAWRAACEHTSAVLVPMAGLFGLMGWASLAGAAMKTSAVVGFHLGGLLLAWLLVLRATRARSGLGYGAAMVLLAIAHSTWTGGGPAPERPLWALGLQLLAVAFFTFWPLLARLDTPGTRRAAALAGPVWFISLWILYRDSFGDSTVGLLAVSLGVMSLLSGYGWVQRAKTRAIGSAGSLDDADQNRSTLAWFGGVTLGFVALAIPLQLDKEWITVGWALQGLAVTFLWKRVDHAGLKYFGLLLHAAVVLRLVANPELLEYYPTGSEPFGLPVLNWLLYAYLVPAAALILSARILEPLELPRLRASEGPLYAPFRERPAIAGGYGMAAVAVIFVWINLTIFDAFAAGAPLGIPSDRQPTRDLVLSLSWALYAICLLMIGVARKSVPLRWISLAFFLLTIGKVFVYDLGELTDLFRVASLVGLAVSLILVSLLYQRFVFGRDRKQPPEAAE